MKLSYMLIGGFLIVALLVGVIGYVSITTFRDVDIINNELQSDIVPGAIKMMEIDVQATLLHLHAAEYIAKSGPERKVELQESAQKLVKAGQEHYEYAVGVGGEERADAERLNNQITALVDASNQIVNLKDMGVNMMQLHEEGEKTLHPPYEALIETLEEHKEEHMQELADAQNAVMQAHVTSNRNILTSSIAVLLLAIALGLFISFSISKSIKKLTNAVDDVSKGRLDATIEKSNIYEVNKLAEALDRVMTTMKRAIKRVKPSKNIVAEEEPEEMPESDSEFEKMKKQFEQIQKWQKEMKKMRKK